MNSLASEQAALYVLLTDGSRLSECNLDSSDFSTQSHKIIYEAIQAVAANGKAIDIITVSEDIEQKYRTVDMNYFGQLIEKGVGTGRYLSEYCASIKEAARKRKGVDIANTLQQSLQSGSDSDPIALAIKELIAIDKSQKNHNHTLKQCLESGLTLVQEAHEKDGGLVGITTGIKDLDESTGGFHDTDLAVIGARPAMGKTSLLFSMAHAANMPCGIISAEQGMAQAGLRMLSIHGSIDSQKLRTANLSDHDWSMVSGSTLALKDRQAWLNDEASISITGLIRQAREWKFNHDIKILYVDYIQKIKGSNPSKSKTEQVTEVTQSLKNLARELNIPVVALAQVKRDVESRSDRRPKAGDMSDASEIEKEADVIITLYRDEVYDEHTQDYGIAELDICKNRHGPTGLIKTLFIGKYFQFKDFQNVSNIYESKTA